MKLSSAALAWEDTQDLGAPVPGNALPASYPRGARARGARSRQSPGAAGHLGPDLSFEKVTFGKPPSLPGLALTCLPPSSGLPGAF